MATRGRVRHRLTNKDISALTADCAECGLSIPILEKRVSKTGRYEYICKRGKGASSAVSHRRSQYGLEPEDYKIWWIAEGKACAICRREAPLMGSTADRSLHVDHDHETGLVRGLLCFNCNAGLGKFEDDIERMEAAIEYLKARTRPAVFSAN